MPSRGWRAPAWWQPPDASAADASEVFTNIEERLTDLVNGWLEKADPHLPIILTAHASVQGAKYGSERTVMLGADLVLPGSLVRDARLDYVALGHIHKPQDLNENAHPPVIYPGSIERVDFGEAGDDKFFIIAEVEKGNTKVEWRQLTGVRPFIDRFRSTRVARGCHRCAQVGLARSRPAGGCHRPPDRGLPARVGYADR